VEQCLTAGLVWGEELYLDATKVDANAATDSLRPRFAVEAHLAHLFAQEEPDDGGDDRTGDPDGTGGDEPARLPGELTPASRSELAERAAQRHDWIGSAGRPNRSDTSGAYRRTADFRVSTTDPDATPLPQQGGHTHLGYQDHYVVDGGKARIVLMALVAPAEIQENQPALDLVWRTCFRWKLRPQQVTGDTKYGTVENITALEQERICAYMPLSAVGQRAGKFGEQDFVYDVAADAYRCPGGQTLRFLSQYDTTRRRIYAAPAAACSVCELRSQCTTSNRGRRVGRSLDEAYLDRVRGYHATEPFAKAMRKRQVWVEPLFAEAKQWHGLRRFRLRGWEKVNGEALVIAAGQNIKRLLSWWGWGRRPFPSGAAGAVHLGRWSMVSANS